MENLLKHTPACTNNIEIIDATRVRSIRRSQKAHQQGVAIMPASQDTQMMHGKNGHAGSIGAGRSNSWKKQLS